MKSLKIIPGFILGAVASFILFLVCLIFYRFVWEITDWESLRVWISATYFSLTFIMFWVFRRKRIFCYTLLIVSVGIIGACFYEYESIPENQFAYEWPIPKDTLQLPFTVGPLGHLYIEATINDTTGLFLFDTGSSLCIVNEALIKNPVKTPEEHRMTDAQGISQHKKQIIVNRFQVGDIVCTKELFWPADSASWGKQGAFEDQEKVLGIIGNTFLTNFVWDFDMVNQTVTLARSNHAIKEIRDKAVLPLQHIGNQWKLPVAINGKEKLVLLDFGHTTPLQIEDSISYDKKTIFGIGENMSKSAFMHTLADSTRTDSIFYFLAESISLGNQSFDSIICIEKAHHSLLGMPFLWAFERVVLDYPDKKIYLIKKQDDLSKFDVRTINHQFRESIKVENIQAGSKGYFDIHTKYFADNMAPTITENQDTVMEKFRIYGTARYWGRNLSDLDSIQCMDSILLPNGNIRYAPFTIEMK